MQGQVIYRIGPLKIWTREAIELMGPPSQEAGYPLLQEIHRKDAGNRFKGGHPALFYGLRLFLMPQRPVNVLSLAH
jgi:hypothetical protein